MNRSMLIICLLFSVTSTNASIGLQCFDHENNAMAHLEVEGPEKRSFTTTSCLKWERTRNCSINPGYDDDIDLCECLVEKAEVHNYRTWHVKGSLIAPSIDIELDFELDQFSDSKRLGGTQSGRFGVLSYTTNYHSEDSFEVPGNALTVILMYGDKSDLYYYRNQKRARLTCSW